MRYYMHPLEVNLFHPAIFNIAKSETVELAKARQTDKLAGEDKTAFRRNEKGKKMITRGQIGTEGKLLETSARCNS